MSRNAPQDQSVTDSPAAESLRQAYRFGQLAPISVHVVGAEHGDSLVLTFERLASWSATELLRGLAASFGLDSESIRVEGNVVTVPVPQDQDADVTAAAVRVRIDAQFLHAANIAVVEQLCKNCGAHGNDTFAGEIVLDSSLTEAELAPYKEQLNVLGVETIWVGGLQVLRITPTKFFEGDKFAVRRITLRVARLLKIEVIGDVTYEKAKPNVEAMTNSPAGRLLARVLGDGSPFGDSGIGMPPSLAILSNLIGGLPGFPGSNGGRRSGGIFGGLG